LFRSQHSAKQHDQMLQAPLDILMITSTRPHYTRLSLPALLASCDDAMRVWVWHNGGDDATWHTVQEYADHPRIAQVHRNDVNSPLSEPTNWLWTNSVAPLVGKVDDDILVEPDWAQQLRAAHAAIARAGVLSAWTFPESDFDVQLASHKIESHGSTQIMRNAWVGGGCYVMNRACIDGHRLLQEGESFADWCRATAWQRWVHGWPLPLVVADHMDDPRSPHTALHDDADIANALPLTAQRNGITTTQEWQALLEDVARTVQTCPAAPGKLYGLRSWRYRIASTIHRKAA